MYRYKASDGCDISGEQRSATCSRLSDSEHADRCEKFVKLSESITQKNKNSESL